MKNLIEKYLTDFGYTNLEWNLGRKGFYIMADSPYVKAKECIDINALTTEMLENDLQMFYCHRKNV